MITTRLQSETIKFPKNGRLLPTIGKDDKALCGDEECNKTNPSSTAGRRYTPFRDRLSDENQHCNSSTTLHIVGYPILTPRWNKRTSNWLQDLDLEFMSLAVAGPYIRALPKNTKHVAVGRSQLAGVSWPTTTKTTNGKDASMMAGKLTGVRPLKAFQVEGIEIFQFSTQTKSQLGSLQDEVHISCACQQTPKIYYVPRSISLQNSSRANPGQQECHATSMADYIG